MCAEAFTPRWWRSTGIPTGSRRTPSPCPERRELPISELAHTNIYIGIDIGTSGVRAIAIDDGDAVLAEQRLDLPLPVRHGPGCEQAPAIWWEICQRTLGRLLQSIDRQSVRAIAIDGTSGTVLLTDADGQPLTTALMYNDARATAQLARIQQFAPAATPANVVTAGLPKVLWLAEQARSHPIRHIMHQADWLAFQFTRRAGMSDHNNCLKLGYDPVAHAWPDWLQQLGIPRDWLPAVLSPGQPLAPITPEIAHKLDLPADVIMVSGTTDSTAAIYATGAQQVGDAVTSLGSTLVCKVISDKPVVATGYGIYSQPFGDNWLVGGASNSGGAVLRQYFTDAQMQALTSQLDPEQSTGLNYYPLPATGERFPINDPMLEPVMIPRPADDAIFFQGLLEGIAQIEYNGYRLLHELGAPYPDSVRTVGGGAKNPAWTLIRSRLLNTNMYDADHTEAAYGSALLARQGYTRDKETRS